MKTTVLLDATLLEDASAFTGIQDKDELVRRALVQFVQIEAARQLAEMGGTQPELGEFSRREF